MGTKRRWLNHYPSVRRAHWHDPTAKPQDGEGSAVDHVGVRDDPPVGRVTIDLRTLSLQKLKDAVGDTVERVGSSHSG